VSNRSRVAAGLYVVLVFLSGVLVGAFGYRLYSVQTVKSNSPDRPRTPEEYRKRYVQEMRNRLKLSDQQVSSLQQIMDDTGQSFRDLREKDRPVIRGIEQEQYQKVLAILNPDQQAEYEKMRAERERRRQQRSEPAK